MKLLLGIWEGEQSRRALTRTAERAAATGDRLVVAVVDRAGGDPDGGLVERAREALSSAGLDPDVRALSGDPTGGLVELAETEGFDRLVVGDGAKSPMGKIEVDPVVQAVLLNCHVSVTVVREP